MQNKADIMVYPDLLAKQTHRSDVDENPWRTARDRTLRYLDALGISPFEALDLSRQAIDKARDAAAHQKTGHPVATTMQMMRQLLIEQQIIDVTDQNPETGIKFLPIPVFPEWNRGNMVPQKLEIAPWNRLAGKSRKFISFRWIAPYIALMFLLIYVYLML